MTIYRCVIRLEAVTHLPDRIEREDLFLVSSAAEQATQALIEAVEDACRLYEGLELEIKDTDA